MPASPPPSYTVATDSAVPGLASSAAPTPASAAPPKNKTATKLPSLTGMRWLAAFLVFGYHIGTLNVIKNVRVHHDWDYIFGYGQTGVSFFFVLSGFVLVWSARSGDTAVRFWRRRIAKIYPNHVVTWAIVIALMFAWGDQVTGEAAFSNLFLIHPWINYNGIPYSINSVSWSLGCEAFFYLCFPLVLPLVRRMPVWSLYLAAGALYAGIHIAYLWSGHYNDPWSGWLNYQFPPVRSLEFWLGVVIGELVVRRQWRGPGLWVGTAVIIAIYGGTRGIPWFPLSIPPDWWSADLPLAFALFIAGAAQADITGAWSPWRWRPLVWLGEISFAFYMVHVAFIENTLRWLHRDNGHGWGAGKGLLVVVFFLGVSIFLAWLLYRFVETPMMRILGPRRIPRPQPAPGGPVDEAQPAPALPTEIAGPRDGEEAVAQENATELAR
ncbi:acyltransferase [Catenulispora sp. NL8]|uniref:Acyltransferase n=1 Tax=Catenulispora pinistramenti TaxID=2705254 RepID=A0ABS5KQG3_9ACTN|nr:acyltransferase [Catenulispora pinistramenti]MBS2548269.1 acyltransferase [Catenulispora pinistramenti]